MWVTVARDCLTRLPCKASSCVSQALTFPGGARFITWRRKRTFLGECRRIPRHFRARQAYLGYGPAPGPTENSALCHTHPFFGACDKTGSLALWVECSPIVRETGVQSQVVSYQRLKKWYLIPPCLTLSNIRYVSRVKWSNPGKGEAPSPTPRCSSY